MPIIDGEFLDDLASRFIINVPVEERSNLIRICFQVELAHWFYLDFFCATEDDLVPCGIKQFAMHLFKHVPFLRAHVGKLDGIMDEWKKYKLSVPTYGAILLNAELTHVLLVQSFWAKSSWGFPKGKVNENEDPMHCAVREVYEETGYDSSQLISPTDFFESIFNYQFTRLYVVAGVPMDTEFVPRTRNEIKSCEWFPIDLLPNHKTDTECKTNLGMNANSFFMVMPFLKKLKKWIQSRRDKMKHKMPKSESKAMSNNKRQRHKSMGDIENLWQGANPSACAPNESAFYQSSAHNMPSGSKTVAKCGGDTPMNKQHQSTPAEVKRARDKGNKANIKRQLFGPDVTMSTPDHNNSSSNNMPTSPSPFNFSFSNFPVKPPPPHKYPSGARPKLTTTGGSGEDADRRLPLKRMEAVRFKEWDSFKFDTTQISRELSGLPVVM